MAVLKCKMCGGDLNIIEGVSTAECEFCGSVQTVPKVDDEKKLILFARANRLRAACEFDKAAGIYEAIVADFPEEAEAYWGLVLCKYGIEYVDDPATGKKIPTCHRSSFEFIMEDADLEQALENADTAARKVYRDEAKQIEEIRKGIIAVSANEQPYDIFICYKETDENGERTLDSVLAQDVYDALTDKGYRVFFSRITLEDKLGMEYEPYIFAALNSAKIMLAFGTDYEYFSAVWVKNEWSRFLKLMAKDKTKHLIPCFKGIDAYDMPKEFARLQAQDLGRIGAVQDILRGIEKIYPRNEVKNVDSSYSVTVSADNYVKRGKIAIEDSNWEDAVAFFEKALDLDANCAEAYLGLAMCEKKVFTIEELVSEISDENKTFNRAKQFADEALLQRIFIIESKVKSEKTLELTKKLALRREEISMAQCLIAASAQNTLAIKTDGTVVATKYTGADQYYSGLGEVADWKDIVAISAGDKNTLGLRKDGTVVSTDYRGNQSDDCGQSEVLGWKNIISISAGSRNSLGLHEDGTVISTNYRGDPKFNFGQCEVSEWKDIIAIAAGAKNALGLRSDGTVVSTKFLGDSKLDFGQCEVSEWKDIVAIAVGFGRSVGLKNDGTVVSTKYRGDAKFDVGQFDVSSWSDIVAIAVGNFCTVGLRADGTVLATGNYAGQHNFEVEEWTEIVAISAGSDYIIGLRSDGTIMYAGHKAAGRDMVSNIKLFNKLETVAQEREQASKASMIDKQSVQRDQQKAQQQKALEAEKVSLKQKAEQTLKQQLAWRGDGLCQYCGGVFKGLFSKKCSSCGKAKDY